MSADNTRLLSLKMAHNRVASVFEYERDDLLQQALSKPEGWATFDEHWASWHEIKAMLDSNHFRDDCDGWALAVRGILWNEFTIPSYLVHCQLPEGGHLICSTVDGWCSDNRFPMGVVSRDDLVTHHGYKFLRRSALQTDENQDWRIIE